MFFPLDAGHAVEALSVGSWVGISGAAFTTGLGVHTSIAKSVLLALANVRLGYWWDSGIDPADRAGQRSRPTLGLRMGEFLNRLAPVHSCFVQEMAARFHGPNRRRWYLSDGGHFENTGCYELIRRRLPFIVLCDCGCDPDFTFEDLANLVRKARTDFGADIRLLDRTAIRSRVGVQFDGVIGELGDFQRRADATASGGAETAGRRVPHALLADVFYDDRARAETTLLIVKPGVSGDESVDVTEYRSAHPRFPHEPTLDQLFDEAQWESYRQLGEHIGRQLFAPAATGSLWAPRQMRPLP